MNDKNDTVAIFHSRIGKNKKCVIVDIIVSDSDYDNLSKLTKKQLAKKIKDEKFTTHRYDVGITDFEYRNKLIKKVLKDKNLEIVN